MKLLSVKKITFYYDEIIFRSSKITFCLGNFTFRYSNNTCPNLDQQIIHIKKMTMQPVCHGPHFFINYSL